MPRHLRNALPFVFGALFAVCAPHGLGAEPPPLNPRVTELIRAAGLKGGSVGVSVIDVKTGQVLAAVDDNRQMTPASNLKIVTTGCALLVLGEKYEFKTTVYAGGPVDSRGALDGDLVVVGSGDPAISGREHEGKSTAVFDAWAAEIARSVRSVSGNLVIDDTIFDRQYVHPSWPADQLMRWYCAPVSAFALNDDCIDVTVRPAARAGDPAVVTLDPPTRYFRVTNTCRTLASGQSKAFISRAPDSDTILVSGVVSAKGGGAESPVAVVNPGLFAGAVLRERLEAAGVTIAGKVVLADKAVDTARMKALASSAHSLVSAVQTANRRSQNFYAEMMLKTLGRKPGVSASFDSGVRAVSAVLDKAGIKPGTYAMEDGSGMSARNAFTPLQFAWFLRVMAISGCADAFIGSLPVSGADGTTLERRLGKAPYAGAVFAKTGHLHGVTALSGYARSGDKLLAFSVLCEGRGLDVGAADRLQDSIAALLVDSIK